MKNENKDFLNDHKVSPITPQMLEKKMMNH
jgi:predicted transcriptional regulator